LFKATARFAPGSRIIQKCVSVTTRALVKKYVRQIAVGVWDLPR
jgi:hypothetical protein